MSYLFSSESVSEGHPDKVADQISDAILDQFLAYDDKAHCAVESFVTTGQVVIMGEVRSAEYIDLATMARRTITRLDTLSRSISSMATHVVFSQPFMSRATTSIVALSAKKTRTRVLATKV